jgi:HAD superfamily hydrolase (TIGR01490 family)
LALFDFDGTITRKDSFLAFIRFAKGNWKFFFGMLLLLPVLLAYKVGLVANDKAKVLVLRFFFSGTNAAAFFELGQRFALEKVPLMVRKEALAKIRWHLNQQHVVVVVSASAEAWVARWCDKMGMQLVATRLEVKQGRITGYLSSANCYGTEKVRRIKQVLDISSYDRVYAYGDTPGDKPMLALAHEQFYRCF